MSTFWGLFKLQLVYKNNKWMLEYVWLLEDIIFIVL